MTSKWCVDEFDESRSVIISAVLQGQTCLYHSSALRCWWRSGKLWQQFLRFQFLRQIKVKLYLIRNIYTFITINDADRGFLTSLESRMLCFPWPLLQQQQYCLLFSCSTRCCQCLSQCILIIARKRFLRARSIEIKKIKIKRNPFLLLFIYLYIFCSIKYVPSWSKNGHALTYIKFSIKYIFL
jgi:hypothetical protein